MKTNRSVASESVVVDLDGTLIRTDTLYESLSCLLQKSPVKAFLIPIWLLRGRAFLKSKIASLANFEVKNLPFRDDLIEYLNNLSAEGHRIHLATAADQAIATRIAEHIPLFETVLASNGNLNLKGKVKLTKILETIGPNFIYVGDSYSDLPIWKKAESAIYVGSNDGLAAEIEKTTPVRKQFSTSRRTLKNWLRALRVHQWSKNSLLLVPLFTSFQFTVLKSLSTTALAFLAFSLLASATYLLNDLVDLNSDRQHSRKRYRPLANGDISIPKAFIAACALLFISIALSFGISFDFLYVLLSYLVATTLYSAFIKKIVMADAVCLALLFTLRIFAGGVAIRTEISSWLLLFSVFIFFSLAIMKRCAELVNLQRESKSRVVGRDYHVSDLATLRPLGIAAAIASLIVFGLLIQSPETQSRYSSPQMLWAVSIFLLHWISLLWIKTDRGEMHDDPIVFTFTNRISLNSLLLMASFAAMAYCM